MTASTLTPRCSGLSLPSRGSTNRRSIANRIVTSAAMTHPPPQPSQTRRPPQAADSSSRQHDTPWRSRDDREDQGSRERDHRRPSSSRDGPYPSTYQGEGSGRGSWGPPPLSRKAIERRSLDAYSAAERSFPRPGDSQGPTATGQLVSADTRQQLGEPDGNLLPTGEKKKKKRTLQQHFCTYRLQGRQDEHEPACN